MTTWLLMRSSGFVALVALTAVVVLGIAATAPHVRRGWMQGVHVDLALLAVVLLGVHIGTAVVDSHIQVQLLDVVVPFRVDYRPLWLGLGTLAVDVLLAMLLTSLLRRHLGARVWRRVHWLAYVAWPLSLVHALGAGTDAGAPVAVGVTAACACAVLLTVLWRAALVPGVRRTLAALSACAVIGAVAGWALAHPLSPPSAEAGP